jgi:Ca2+-binding EF-hand superfamily protein
MTSTPLSLNDLETVMKDIIAIRSEPKTMIEKFNIILYSLKGFKKNESTVYFLENFIHELNIMEPLPKFEIDPYLGMVAQKILDASEKKKVQPDKLSNDEINIIAKPYMRNYDQINLIYETHNSASKFLGKIVLREDPRGNGFESPTLSILFDDSLTKIGAAGRMIGKTGHYLILTVDNYEKYEKRSDLTDEEYSEYKRIFKLFDIDDDGILEVSEFNEIVNRPGVKASWPLIGVFQKLLFKNGAIDGANLNDFIDTIINFGLFDNDDVIRRIFNLYRDDVENDTLSLVGLRRVTNDLEIEPHKTDVNNWYRTAYDKNTFVTYKEFYDFIKKEQKAGRIALPRKL